MFIKIVVGFIVILAVFLGYVSTREGKFHYERSDYIQAPADKIFPYISNFKMGGLWNPFEKKDPNMKKTYTGTDGQVGSVLEFDGNREAGSGTLEMLKIVPNELVVMKLTMTKPMKAENIIEYKLTPDAGVTRFTWSMSGDGGFMGKLVNVFIDCEKMIAGPMLQGIADLKTVVASQK